MNHYIFILRWMQNHLQWCQWYSWSRGLTLACFFFFFLVTHTLSKYDNFYWSSQHITFSDFLTSASGWTNFLLAAMTEFWLISAPGEKTCQQTWDKLMLATTRTNNLSTNNKFNIPDLKVMYNSPLQLLYSGHMECMGGGFGFFLVQFVFYLLTGRNTRCVGGSVRWAGQTGHFCGEVMCIILS